MALTKNQISTLRQLYEDHGWPGDSQNAHGNTLNSLFARDLITSVCHANGSFWYITDKGIDMLDHLSQKL